jgi:hypothetical protein
MYRNESATPKYSFRGTFSQKSFSFETFFQLAETLCDMDLLLVISKQSTDPDMFILVTAISSGLQLCWINVLSELMNKGILHLNFGDIHMNKPVNLFSECLERTKK